MLAYGLVSFKWAEPTAAFQSNLELIGQVADVWLPGEVKTTPVCNWVVPENIPLHACLLAEIDSPLDPVPAPAPISVADRHYAQQNLVFLKSSAKKTIKFSFFVNNPKAADKQAFEMRVTPDMSNAAAAIAHSQHLSIDFQAARLSKPHFDWDTKENSSREHKGDLINLEGGESKKITLNLKLPEAMEKHSAIVFKIEQIRQRDDQSVGSLGIVVTFEG